MLPAQLTRSGDLESSLGSFIGLHLRHLSFTFLPTKASSTLDPAQQPTTNNVALAHTSGRALFLCPRTNSSEHLCIRDASAHHHIESQPKDDPVAPTLNELLYSLRRENPDRHIKASRYQPDPYQRTHPTDLLQPGSAARSGAASRQNRQNPQPRAPRQRTRS